MNILIRKYLFICLAVLVGLAACESKPGGTPAKVRFDKTVVDTVESKMAQLEMPVTVHLYRGGSTESSSQKIVALLDLLKEKSDLLSVEEHDLDQASDIRESQKADHGPVVIPKGPENSRSSFLGFPSRKELAPFLDTILIVSGQVPELTPGTEAFLKSLDEEIFIRVFTSPD